MSYAEVVFRKSYLEDNWNASSVITQELPDDPWLEPNHVKSECIRSLAERQIKKEFHLWLRSPVRGAHPFGRLLFESFEPQSSNKRVTGIAGIEAFANLSPGWAGDDTVPPSEQVRKSGKEFISALPNYVTMPQISPTGDGEIVFAWYFKNGRVQALIDPDNVLAWVARSPSEHISDATSWNGSLPRGLLACLRNTAE